MHLRKNEGKHNLCQEFVMANSPTPLIFYFSGVIRTGEQMTLCCLYSGDMENYIRSDRMLNKEAYITHTNISNTHSCSLHIQQKYENKKYCKGFE